MTQHESPKAASHQPVEQARGGIGQAAPLRAFTPAFNVSTVLPTRMAGNPLTAVPKYVGLADRRKGNVERQSGMASVPYACPVGLPMRRRELL